jgi:hypothetical protein
VEFAGEEMFFAEVYLQLIDLIWHRCIEPGKVFDLPLPLEPAAKGYQAIDERRAIKTLLIRQSHIGGTGERGMGPTTERGGQ